MQFYLQYSRVMLAGEEGAAEGWLKQQSNKDFASALGTMVGHLSPQAIVTQLKKQYTVPIEALLKPLMKLDPPVYIDSSNIAELER